MEELMVELRGELESIKRELAEIREQTHEIKKDTHKMDLHINFVEAIYNQIKKPFHYVMDTISQKRAVIKY